MSQPNLPKLPTKIADFISHLSKNPNEPVAEIIQPYKSYEGHIRKLYAQNPEDVLLNDPILNLVPIFAGQQSDLKIRARDFDAEDEIQKSKYIMPLKESMRKPDGSPSVVSSLKDFRHNFNIFSESSLTELDWSNVVAAGSSVVTSLLPIPSEYAGSKRGLRTYYHDVFTPASDVDLFLYDLTEDQALEKIKSIERAIKDSILTETTTIRTKNAITIASKHPTRHVQIVLRIYKSISEILTGFDVDCSCVAYDGKQVYASPRAIAAFVTQINEIDLSRRSPSYESRLSKYSRRGFEAYWPQLDRTRIDPTIYERSFARTVGLARLLVLEKLPTESDRESYLNKRRTERGRPQMAISRRNNRSLRGNIKEDAEDEIADWAIEDDVSNYHSFTIPYGEKFNARRIERLLYTKDLLLNAEWNTKERDVNLHRHPAFFGDAEDIFEDCCGCCPKPKTDEELKVAGEESKHYVSGRITFLTDNPGRQEIGSFNPITDTDWTEMAYVQNTQKLFQAIAGCDLATVKMLLLEEKMDPNVRDYTGRTPLHLAVTSSTVEVVQCLLDHGAYLVPRLAAGETSMHLAAARGDVEIMKALDEKSKRNKVEAEKRAREEVDGFDVTEAIDSESDAASEASGETSTFVKVESCAKLLKDESNDQETTDTKRIELKDDVLDPDVVAWDAGCTPAHIATVFGNIEALNYLLNEHGSDPNIPIKLKQSWTNQPRGAILSLVLALTLPAEKAEKAASELLSAGARCSQADLNGATAFHYFVNQGLEALEMIIKIDPKQAKSVLDHIMIGESYYSPSVMTPLKTAIGNRDLKTAERLLELGASPSIEYDAWLQAYQRKHKDRDSFSERYFLDQCEQPVLHAVKHEMPQMVKKLIEIGVDINTTNKYGHPKAREVGLYFPSNAIPGTILDEVRAKIAEQQEARTDKSSTSKLPEPLKDDSYYLADYSEGSYGHWIMSEKLREAKDDFKRRMENYEASLESKPEDVGKKLKQEALEKLVEELKDLENFLVERGAKTYLDLNPKLSELDSARMEFEMKSRELRKLESTTYEGRFRWQPQNFDFKLKLWGVLEPTEQRYKEYLQLFSAAWDGNETLVQELTTIPRGENKDEPPLTISVQDMQSHNPFTIALLRGHTDLAMKILTIAQAQYTPNDTKLSYTVESEDGSNDSQESDDEDISESGNEDGNDRIVLYSRLPASVRNQFTIEDIGKISTLVNCHTTPVQVMMVNARTTEFPLGDALPKPSHSEYPMRRTANVIDYAIYAGDNALFDKLLDIAISYNTLELQTDDSKPRKFRVPDWTFKYALKLGRIEMLSKMMARTCAGIPLTQLAEKSGVKTTKKSKYYQGLSIRGKKNEAWAASYRRGGVPFNSEDAPPLLLNAAQETSVESFEWLLSDAPLRLYKEYAANNKDDDRLKVLFQSKHGFEKTIVDWLDAKGMSLILLSQNLV
jgi:Ankyrin repeats (3 copies)